MSKAIWFSFLAAFLCLQARAVEEVKPSNSLEILNMDKLAGDLKLDSFKKEKFGTKVKIAIFDNGFWGYGADLGKRLPADTVCYSNSETPDQQCNEEFKIEEQRARDSGRELKDDEKPFHGLMTAEIITQILARAGDSNYQMTMFRTSGLDRLSRAIKRTVAEKYDVIVYADVWEFGGFGDGRGFVNAAVNEALKAGIVWINSAGNFGRNVRLAPVETTADDYVTFKAVKGKSGASDSISVRCTLKTSCNLRLVLAWNDFKDDPEAGSDKQLNLYLLDDKKIQVAASEKVQKIDPPANDKQYTKLPRQMILFKLEAGTPKKPKIYSIKVKNISKNFSAQTDKLRITASGIGVEMLDPSLGETILPPADNPGLIAIGASDDPGASSSRKLGLPKIYLRSMIELKNGLRPFESSTAAAMAGAMAAIYIGNGTPKSREAVEKKMLAISRATEFPLPASSVTESAAPSTAKTKPSTSAAVAAPSVASTTPKPKPVARPVVHAQRPRYPAPSVATARTAPRGAGRACLMPVPPAVDNPWLAQQLADFLTLGGSATVEFNGRFGVAVYYDLSEQFGMNRSSPYDRFFLTREGVVLLSPDLFYLIDGQPFVPLFETSALLCR